MHKPLIAAALLLASVAVCLNSLAGPLRPRHTTRTALRAPAPIAHGGVTESVLAPGTAEIVFDDTAAEEITAGKS